MTEDKIYDCWDKLKIQYNFKTSAELDKYISGETDEKNFNFQRGIKFHEYPKEIVRELDGENSELAKRILYVISQINNKGLIIGNWGIDIGNIKVCKKLGYTFEEVFNSLDVITTSNRYLCINTYQIAEALVKEYSESFNGIDNINLFIQNTINDKGKFTVLVNMLAVFLNKDKEKYHKCVELIKSNIDKLENQCANYLICRVYTLDDSLKEIFIQRIQNIANISLIANTLKNFMNRNTKDVFFELGEQEKYYEYRLSSFYNYYNDDKLKVINELYDYDKEMFIRIYKKTFDNKINAVFMLVKMLESGDTLDDADENIQKFVSNFMREIVDSLNDLNIADFIRLINAEDIKEASAEITTNQRYGYFTMNGFSVLSVLYKYNKIAQKVVKFMFNNFYYHNEKDVNLAKAFSTFCNMRTKYLKISEYDSINLIVNDILPIESIFKIYCYSKSNDWYAKQITIDNSVVRKFAEDNSDKALAFFDTIKDVQYVSAWLELYYSLNCEKSFEPLINNLKSKSKIVRKKSFEIAENYESEIRADLEKIFPKLKGDAAINVSQLIKKWDNIRKFGKDFAFVSNELTEEFCKENILPASVRKISWIDESCFEGIRYADLNGTASPDVLKYIISEYMALNEPCRIAACDKVAQRLNKSDLQDTLENIFKMWVESGADTKKKFISLPYCIYASDTQILKLKKQLEDWAKASRGALASFVVGNIPLNGGSVALITVDAISNKFPNNMVKNAAKSSFIYAAEVLEVSVDELSDRIVPNLGFNKNGERIFDYGERTFTVSLMPDFTLTIHDNAKNKDVKSMPKPNDKDDAVKAESAKKEFSELKKQIKAVVTSQKNRLEKVLMDGRTWTSEKWRNLFEENAVMHCYAEKLVWGTYENGELKDTFRYLSDGSFCNEDDDEYELPENAEITLVHPVELSDELIGKWLEQFDDYEIVQPFNQLNAVVVKINESDVSDNIVTKYMNKILTVGKFASTAKKYNMERGETGDGGSFDGYVLYDEYLGIYFEADAEPLYFGQDYNESIDIKDLKFSSIEGNCVVNPMEISKRFVSSCLAIIESIVDM